MRKFFLSLVFSLFAAMFFLGCNPSNRGSGENHKEPGMYVGITGFNKYCYMFGNNSHRYWRLTKENESDFTSFVNSLSYKDENGNTINGTVLYYAIDNALTYLETCSFPDKLKNISIITFTDGLDQGSSTLDRKDGNNEYANNTSTYVEAISKKIRNLQINGVSVDAYAIGLRGSDIPNSEDVLQLFRNNLIKLSSKEENAMEVTNMTEVNAKFRTIAESLYKQNITTTFKVRIPEPGDNDMPERFTLDLPNNADSPDASKMYIEGKYDRNNGALKDIKYVGCMSSSGNVVKQEVQSDGDILFSFEDFTDDKGEQIPQSKMNVRQWNIYSGTSTWVGNNEFSQEKQPKLEIKQSSAVVILLLDCSSSLGSDLSKVKSAANQFIQTLANGVENSTNPGTDPGTDPGTETAYYIKHPWGSGADSSWSWKKMTKINDSNYEYSGLWGGVGANINTTASDNGAQWFDASSISGASSLSVGDGVKFTYNSSTNKLSATKTSSGGSSNKTQVRFRKENAYEYVLAMSIEKINGSERESTGAEHEFGTASGTSSYYDISSGVLYPLFYYDDGSESGWYLALDSESYNFVAGKKYTYTCSDDGTYLTFSIQLDGNAGAPAKVIASRRIQKTKIHNLPKVRK